jgi:hypothetical protein
LRNIVSKTEFKAHKIAASLVDCIIAALLATAPWVAVSSDGRDSTISSSTLYGCALLGTAAVSVVVWRYLRSAVYREDEEFLVVNPYRVYRLLDSEYPIALPRRLGLARSVCLVNAEHRDVTLVALPASEIGRLE